ncbi:MAG: enoyl-CoA hydratase/isomerase family protein [Thermodesulfobacteriota bacterium]
MSNQEEVLWEVKDKVGTIIINRPAAQNALNTQVISAIYSLIDSWEAEGEVRCIVLTGAGGKAFCAGADLSVNFGDKPFWDQQKERGLFAQLLTKINLSSKPILAAVDGYCLAGGLGLCLACDLVVASEESQFGLPEIKRGLWPYLVTAVLIRHLGPKKALELCLLGERISAAQAAKLGLINYCVPKTEFPHKVAEVARKLASFSPAVMALGKKSFYTMLEMDFSPALEYLQGQLGLHIQLADLREGISAFLQKREPVWQGR